LIFLRQQKNKGVIQEFFERLGGAGGKEKLFWQKSFLSLLQNP
jgi:hypothetical protein